MKVNTTFESLEELSVTPGGFQEQKIDNNEANNGLMDSKNKQQYSHYNYEAVQMTSPDRQGGKKWKKFVCCHDDFRLDKHKVVKCCSED